jgi:hemoglobin
MTGKRVGASAPIPETEERRALQSRAIATATGLDDAMLERLVRSFYGAARQDAVLGPVFAGVTDWEVHIATITAFWSSVALQSGRYHGQPLAAHMPLGLDPAHFEQWLALFERTAREVCPPEGASHLIDRAHRIAQSLELGIAARRGELPPRL